MKVKKRTVWMLTLLSLVAVISVYYVNEPNNMPFDGLAIFSDEELDQMKVDDTTADESVTPVYAQSALFEEMRMELQNERSQLKEQLTARIASNEMSADEVNEAYSTMDDLTVRESTEAMLEMLIRSLGYSDALVQTDTGKVDVTVIADELGKSQANEIIHTVMKQWEDAKKVTVTFQPAS
ncbi:SpoIIIAH-like family protein [Paenisporosarcina quisquiliarum]|jgi:stage III sporulation protein AH|uniref:SpoIIIAH-like family protein n=1 Tax=Paenisporosarcina quisquiliarum TaxID=365346 RepID=A0A9X3LK18_9BACL|nr:SpoIIIAH-like family protein [Paenisporosarcina quisquiliarum]MCZ8537954.1 SpoIIIAH-like family protein [Paenisporosarcina quisquiliarum]